MKKYKIFEGIGFSLYILIILVFLNLFIYRFEKILILKEKMDEINLKKKEETIEKLKIEKKLFNEEEASNLSKLITDIGIDKNVNFKEINEGFSEEKIFKKLIFDVKFQGEFENIINFLEEIRKLKKISLNSLVLNKGEYGNIKGDLILTTYIIKK